MASSGNDAALGAAVLEAVADVLCRPGGPTVRELGAFYAAPPPRDTRTPAAAVRLNAEALGVASWALTPLYRAAKARLGASRADLRAATAVLVAAPDYATGWAARKAALAAAPTGNAAAAEAELALTALLLRRDPKSVETWAHRAWVLRASGAWEGGGDAAVERELAVAAAAAAAKPCNYYAGVHRLRALGRASARVLAGEVVRSRAWVERNVSDCSGWWFHMEAVRRARREGVWTASDADKEEEFAEAMVSEYGGVYQSVRAYEKHLRKSSSGDGLYKAAKG